VTARILAPLRFPICSNAIPRAPERTNWSITAGHLGSLDPTIVSVSQSEIDESYGKLERDKRAGHRAEQESGDLRAGKWSARAWAVRRERPRREKSDRQQRKYALNKALRGVRVSDE
jgi:hypothetical protein